MERRSWRLIVLVAILAILAAACSTDDQLQKGITCVDDSQHCVSERSSALGQLVGDKQRAWMQEPPPAAAYASGVRLFAFKQKTREMTCQELAQGRREADAGPGVLRGPQGQGLTPAQISRGVMLSTEVSRELASEMKRRCPA